MSIFSVCNTMFFSLILFRSNQKLLINKIKMPSIFSRVRSILPFLTVAGWPSHSPTIRLCKDMECQQLFCSTKLSHQTFFCLSLQWTLYTATAYDRIPILFSLQNILGHNVLALLTHFNTEDEDKIEMNILPFFL